MPIAQNNFNELPLISPDGVNYTPGTFGAQGDYIRLNVLTPGSERILKTFYSTLSTENIFLGAKTSTLNINNPYSPNILNVDNSEFKIYVNENDNSYYIKPNDILRLKVLYV